MTTVFFDIGDTLARASFEAGILTLAPLPGARQALEDVEARGIRMGIISYAGDEEADHDAANAALQACGLYEFFDPSLLIYQKKDSAAVFAAAASRAGVAPGQCIFVGENVQERSLALKAGFYKAVPEPGLVLAAIDEAEDG